MIIKQNFMPVPEILRFLLASMKLDNLQAGIILDIS